jgi:site-specific recombinase XerD
MYVLSEGRLHQQQQEGEAFKNFVNSIVSKESKKAYIRWMRYFMDFISVKTYDELLSLDTKSIESHIRDFIIYLRDEKKLADGTINGYVSAVIHFYDCQLHSDINIRWKKLKVFQRKNTKTVDDVPYTREQIAKMLEISQLREKVIILLMSSVGVRRGAIPDLRVGDLVPIDKYQNYKVLVYNRTNDKYVGYCTPECRKYIDQYLQWRTRVGERITDASPLIRLEFDPEDLIQVRNPKPISYSLIDYLIRDLLHKTGIREKQITLEGQQVKKSNRTTLMACHAFRKYFETTVKTAGMDTLYLKRLMGQKTGLEDSYFKPTEENLLEGNNRMLGYVSIIDDLTIDDSQRLQIKVKDLQAREVQHTEAWESIRIEIGQLREKFLGCG